MHINMTLGEKVRQLREDMDLTQGSLGKELGITQRKVSYIESNTYEPSLSDLKAICTFFEISANYLLGLPETLKPYKK
ncbi:MAG: helix-turn-helix transcriptional regulator [Clostridia bacterium]|nr:helix-turn-helix transcriptional regulator [Clostridia bacterium]